MRRVRVYGFAALGLLSLGAAIGMSLVIWASAVPFAWWRWLFGGVWLGAAVAVFFVGVVLALRNRRAASRRLAGFDVSPITARRAV